jgi:Flp pilus assembly protein TadG
MMQTRLSHPLRSLARAAVRGERGQALVETALVLPVVVLLLFAMLDGGRVFHAWIITTNAAREGARAAAARYPEPAVLDRVDDAMAGLTGYLVTTDNLGGTQGTRVTVAVTQDVSMVTPLIGAILGSIVTVEASAIMRLE